MADKKRTTFKDRSPMLDSMDFDLDAFEGMGELSKKAEKKHKPITRIATNVGKGSLSHFTSEGFIRRTVGGALPKGYDTAFDTAYMVKENATQLYNTATQEWRKIKPSAQRAVQRMMPSANKILPKKLADKLAKFSEGSSNSYRQINPDEELLRSVLGELEQTRETERLREYSEKSIKEDLQEQIDTRRFSSQMKVMASVDARLARIQSFNDQVFSRYQRRSLEIQYRQYFTMRDMLKLQGTELANQRELLSGILHNTAMPDIVKQSMKDMAKQSIKERLVGAAGLKASTYGQTLLKQVMGRLTGTIQGTSARAGSALDAGHMMADQYSFMKEMGIDPGAEAQKGIGGMVGGAMMGWMLRQMTSGLEGQGFISQKGAKLGRLISNMPGTLNKYAKSRTTRTGLAGSLEQLLKDSLYRNQENRKIGGANILEMGEHGTFTKKTQKSIEEIMPGYLSMILHELKVMRTGNPKATRVVWNDEREGFTSVAKARGDLDKRLFGNSNITFASNQASGFVDKILAGKTVSAQAHHELKTQLIENLITGKDLELKDLLNPGNMGKHISHASAHELRKAMRGQLRGANGTRDERRLHDLQQDYLNLQRTMPDMMGKLSAVRELGGIEYLRHRGLVSEEGDTINGRQDVLARMIAGKAGEGPRTSTASKNSDTDLFRQRAVGLMEVYTDKRQNLYKPSDLNTPVIEGYKILSGEYINAKTGFPIRVMREVLDGVRYNGQIIVTPEDAKKLVTGSGQKLTELVAEIAEHHQKTTGHHFRGVKETLKQAGRSVDAFLGGETVSKAVASVSTRKKRKAAADAIKDHVKQTAQKYSEPQAVKEALATAAVKSMDLKDRAAEAIKKGWRRVMDVKDYAIDLYKGSSAAPVIDATLLRAGAYLSAKTGKPIKDMRDIADGVVDKAGQVIVSPTEAIHELKAKSGEMLTALINKVQEGLGSPVRSPSAMPGHGPAAGPTIIERAAAVVTGAPVTGSSPTAFAPPHVSAPPTEDSALKELLEAFKEGNFQRLEAIVETLHAMGSMGGGEPGPGGTARKGGWFHHAFGLARESGRRAWQGLKRGGRMYGSYLKTAFGLPFKALGLARRGIGGALGFAMTKRPRLGDEPMDVYVVGEQNPRLTKGDMEAGHYFNVGKDGKPGKPIAAPKDIHGPVMDETGNTIISLDDWKKGLTDRTGKSLIGNVIKGATGLLGGAASFLGGYYSLLFKGVGMVTRGIGGMLKAAVFGVAGKQPQDVYVKGDHPWRPRLYATGMRVGSYFCLDTKKLVRSPDDIRGDVVDMKDHDNIILTKSDIGKGLVDIKGKPFPIKKSLIGKLAGGAFGLAGTLGAGFMGLLGHMANAGFALASAPFRLATRFLGGRGRARLKPGQFLPTADDQTHLLLTEVLRLLDARLPSTKNYRTGSWQDIFAKRKAEKDKEAAAKKGTASGKGGLGLIGKFFDLFRRKDKDESDQDDHDGTTNNYYGDGSDSRHPHSDNAKDARGRKRGGFRRNLEARRLRKLREQGIRGERAGMGAFKGGRFRRMMGRVGESRLGRGLGTVGRYGGRVMGRVGAMAGAGGMFGKVARIGGKLGVGSLLGGMALDSIAAHNQGNMLGTAANVGSTALNAYGIYQAGTGLLSLLGAEGLAAGIGGAVSGVAGAIGTGLSAAATGIGAVLSAPVLLGAAAVAAVGTAAYFGYKYYSLKKKAPLRKLRMAQYGVDMDKSVWPAGKIQKLEALVIPHVRITNGKATIDAKSLEKSSDDILKIFDLKKSWYNPTGWFHSTNKQDLYNQNQFYRWLGLRFRPVLCNWMGALHSIAPNTDLSDVDSKLSDDQKRSLLKTVYAIDPKIYDVADSPFPGDAIATGKKIVDTAYNEAIKDLKPEKKGEKKVEGAAAGIAAAADKDKKGAPPGTKGGVAAAASVGAVAAAMRNTTGQGAATKIGISSTAGLKSSSMFLPNKLSALMALRYKTYGLIKLEPDRVKALFLLETDVLDKVQYASDGQASLKDDASYYFDAYAGYFGVSQTDANAKVRWYSWFAKRFVPTLLQFATAVKHANKTTDPRDADQFLSPQHLLDVANMTKAAVFTSGGTSASVWIFTDSPFDDKPLNTDVKSVEENLQALKDTVKKKLMEQEQAKLQQSKTKSDIDNAADKSKNPPPVKPANDTTFKNAASNKPINLPAGMDSGSAAAEQYIASGGKPEKVGAPVQQPGHGTSGDINTIPAPTGSGLEGVRATIEAAGKMTGMDPKVLETFAGIESSWDPNAHAARSSAAGMYQFIGSTWKAMLAKYAGKYGISPDTPPTDARAAALMMGEFTKENMNYLTKKLGRAPTDSELYLAHFLGPGGAIELLKANPNALGSAVAPSAASSNPGIFYRGGTPQTVGGVLKLIDKRVATFRKKVGGASAETPTALASTAPLTGGNTTTTANGKNGGLGSNVADAARALTAVSPKAPTKAGAPMAGIIPPSMLKSTASIAPVANPSNDGAYDPVDVQQASVRFKAQQQDRQAQVNTQMQQGQMSDVTSWLKRQTQLQQQMVDLLSTIGSHTGTLAQNTTSDSDAKTVPDPQGPVTPPNSKVPIQQTSALPQAAVSVRRTSYG